jgi:hypothetical protein
MTVSYTDTSSGPIVQGTNTGMGAGIEGDNTGSGVGLSGSSKSSFGVYGFSNTGSGVYGISASSDAVVGTASAGSGVFGTSEKGSGVFGTSGGNNPGIYGSLGTPAGGQPAVLGYNYGAGSGSAGPGVVGFSNTGTGVGGGTATGIGFGGVASGSGNGVQGQTASGIAVEGVATGASGFSAYFTGGLGMAVNGNFTVNHGFAKSAAVRGKDGTLVRLYCIESPESWFEDFGRAQLSNGSATVQLEPGFAAVVKTDDYHIFLTPCGDSKGLYVSTQTPASFTVHEQQGGSSTIAFDYRVVAKRKDIAGARLEHVDEPPTVQLLKLPELPPTPPTPPAPAVPTLPRHGG